MDVGGRGGQPSCLDPAFAVYVARCDQLIGLSGWRVALVVA